MSYCYWCYPLSIVSSDDSSSSSEDEGEENGIVGTAGDGTTPPGTGDVIYCLLC